jgi:hypothetical protein
MSAVILIDALDEIGVENERKELLSFLSDCLYLLPPWVKIITTSRPEADIKAAFERFTPNVIDSVDPRHRLDLEVYTRDQMKRKFSNPDDLNEAVALLLERSEGRFIYMAMVADELL